jgi:hypothetical protein
MIVDTLTFGSAGRVPIEAGAPLAVCVTELE